MRRTHRCGELRSDHLGQQVTLMGWVRARRDHGRLIFLDLWDHQGVTQVVADPRASADAHRTMHAIRDEYVIAVQGEVRARPQGTQNPELATGEIELAATAVEVLNATAPLPFPTDDADNVDEVLRMRYRYLDLRRESMQRNLRLRHRAVKALRDYLDDEDFVEVETPVLTRSTPEGARDYLVPSRIYPGSFYALPQSPQQMKQLLMVGGVDRYYQVARCFRDEDLRADRQPEFTQLDLEMSFIDQEDVLSLVESMMVRLVSSLAPDRPLTVPFPRLTYDEALRLYGTDKPDLRLGMTLVDCTALLEESEVRIFGDVIAAGGCIKGFCAPGYGTASTTDLDALQSLSRTLGAEGIIWLQVANEGVASPMARHLSLEEQRGLVAALGAVPGDMLILVAGATDVVHGALDGLRRDVGRRLGLAAAPDLAFAWVVDFPLLKWDSEAGRWNAEHHPFTHPRPDDLDRLTTDPGSVRASCYDLVCNGWELGSGSLRIHERTLQEQILALLAMTPEEAEESFGHLLEAFDYGAPPHGGFAAGIDRLVAILAGTDTIRDVIAFPKTRQASDLTMRAPAPVTPAQLDEIHLRVVPRKG